MKFGMRTLKGIMINLKIGSPPTDFHRSTVVEKRDGLTSTLNTLFLIKALKVLRKSIDQVKSLRILSAPTGISSELIQVIAQPTATGSSIPSLSDNLKRNTDVSFCDSWPTYRLYKLAQIPHGALKIWNEFIQSIDFLKELLGQV